MIPDVAATLLGGLLTGAVYALAGIGLTLIHGVTRLVDFAHGSQMMLAMFLAWVLASRFDIDPYASLPLTTLLMFGAGYLLQRGLLGPAARRLALPHASALLTLGIAAGLEGLALTLFHDEARVVELPYSVSLVTVGPLQIGLPKLVGFGVSAALGAMLWLFLSQTDTGCAIRAVAQEPMAARLVGIRPERSRALAQGIGTACLGAASCLLLPGLPINPQTGPTLLLVLLAAALPGDLGSPAGTIAGGLLAGLCESLADLLLGPGLGVVGVFLVLLVRLSAGGPRRGLA